MNSKITNIVSWIAQIIAVVIMGQSLFYKFTAHEESVAIFTDINMEPYGRILIGVLEVFACLLLLKRSSAHYGALLGFGIMGGAVIGHFTQIGFEGARGQLGAMAFLVMICCAVILFIRRMELPFVGSALRASKRDGAKD